MSNNHFFFKERKGAVYRCRLFTKHSALHAKVTFRSEFAHTSQNLKKVCYFYVKSCFQTNASSGPHNKATFTKRVLNIDFKNNLTPLNLSGAADR